MPHLRVRGARLEHVQTLSETIGAELAPILETSPDNFTVEHIPTQFFAGGKPDLGYPFIEVLWFARTEAIQQRCASHITIRMKTLTGATDVAVVFIPIERKDYFENGVHF